MIKHGVQRPGKVVKLTSDEVTLVRCEETRAGGLYPLIEPCVDTTSSRMEGINGWQMLAGINTSLIGLGTKAGGLSGKC